MDIDLYQRVEIQIEYNDILLTDVMSLFGDVPILTRSFNATTAVLDRGSSVQLRLSSNARLSETGTRPLTRNLLVGPDVLLDRTRSVRISRSHDGTLEIQSCASAQEWVIWTIQLALLQSDATFIHGAGIVRNGRALLFPSWGGIGKTALAAGFVRDRGWKLLGDDLVIGCQDGSVLAFPKPMVLYPYHRSVFPEFFDDRNGPVAPTIFNEMLSDMAIRVKPMLRRVPKLLSFARRHNPQSVRVNPSRIFGADALIASAQLDSVVWLDRVATISRPQLKPIDSSLASRVVGSTLGEFDQHCVSATAIACGLGIVSFADLYPRWFNIIQTLFTGTRGWILHIPADLPVQSVPDCVYDTLAEAGALEGFE